jgi:hypothetical protein
MKRPTSSILLQALVIGRHTCCLNQKGDIDFELVVVAGRWRVGSATIGQAIIAWPGPIL